MELTAGIGIVCLSFFMLIASAQKTTATKKVTDSLKADSSFKKKLFELTNEYDYFSKTAPGKVTIDTANMSNLDDFINQLDSMDKIKASLKAGGKQDRTLAWQLQNGNTDLFVTTSSPALNADHFERFILKPHQAKTLHLDITGSLFSSNSFNLTYVPFYLQVKNTKTIFTDELVQGKKIFNISLPSTDSVVLFFIAHPPENDKAHFHCVWSIGDTAAYSYAGQKPEDVFDKMLELAPNRFTNIRRDKFGATADIEYPGGLFAPLPAERIASYDPHVTQYTGRKLSTGKAADSINAEWNKKISAWLKDYAVTDIKKTESGYRALNTDTGITTYTKKDASGKILFIVKVFKEAKDEGTEIESVSWNTGVSIY